MGNYTAAVIAAGSQGRVHAAGYQKQPGVTVAAVADPNRAVAEELARDLGIAGVYTDYRQMLAATRPNLVSVCTPPAQRLDAVRAAVETGAKAIHVEKPLALTYGDVLDMQQVAADAGVQLTVNLQRRFEPVHRHARQRLADGAIGEIISIEGFCPNLPDWGTHIIDLILFYMGDARAAWVMGQVDVSINRYVYGQFAPTTSLTQISWPSGIYATVTTGREPYAATLNLANNLGIIVHGTKGRLESRGARCLIHRFGGEDELFPTPFSTDSKSWDRGVDPAIVACTAEAIADLIHALETGSTPVLGIEKAVRGAEIIFSTYESSRRRGRVTLPLEARDSALLTGLEQGFWSPVGEQRSTW